MSSGTSSTKKCSIKTIFSSSSYMIDIFSDHQEHHQQKSVPSRQFFHHQGHGQQKFRSSRTSSYFFRDKNWVDSLHTVMVNKNLVHHLLIGKVINKKVFYQDNFFIFILPCQQKSSPSSTHREGHQQKSVLPRQFFHHQGHGQQKI
jgi:hypothetical protein